MNRVFVFGLVLLSFRVATTSAQSRADVLEAFERYATRTTAKVTSSREVGRIETRSARAVISALVVEDPTQTQREMRGIRIDLTYGDLKDTVYASEQLFDSLLKAFGDVAKEPPIKEVQATMRCHGAEMFWLQPGHAFSASYCVAADWKGLRVGTRGGSEPFLFPDVDITPFAAAVGRAKTLLQQ